MGSKSRVTCPLGSVLQGGRCIQCPRGKFSLWDWVACQSLLGCDEVQHEVTRRELLHSLVHWQYYRAEWSGYDIIYATFNTLALSHVDYDNIDLFHHTSNVLYPIGACEDASAILFASNQTFVEVGNHFDSFLASHPTCNTCRKRLHTATSYIHLLTQLHAVNITLCNSRTLSHLLSQFLITSDCTLVLSTLDNFPQETDGPILCHTRELRGKFIAPEQAWPYGVTKIFNVDEQPRYGHVTDIWKVPAVVSSLLTPGCEDVLDYLRGIHLRCKDKNPTRRPTAEEILQEYQQVLQIL